MSVGALPAHSTILSGVEIAGSNAHVRINVFNEQWLLQLKKGCKGSPAGANPVFRKRRSYLSEARHREVTRKTFWILLNAIYTTWFHTAPDVALCMVIRLVLWQLGIDSSRMAHIMRTWAFSSNGRACTSELARVMLVRTQQSPLWTKRTADTDAY